MALVRNEALDGLCFNRLDFERDVWVDSAANWV